jgi:hypothetical protein
MAKNLTSFTKRGVERRTLGSRPASTRILIVCGGQKTEPNYFNELRRRRSLTATLVIEGVGELPLQLVKRAIEKILLEGDFDAAYVVFDRDSFADFVDAINMAKNFRSDQQPDLHLTPIPSGPCFEVWLLLHFVDTDKKFVRTGNDSAGDCVVSELKRHHPQYEKKDLSLFSKISTPERLKLADKRSQRLRKARDDIWSCTFTDVDVLVEALNNPTSSPNVLDGDPEKARTQN